MSCLDESAACFTAFVAPAYREPDEQRLYNQIMGNYLSTVRPALNDSKPVRVLFSMRLNQIVSLVGVFNYCF